MKKILKFFSLPLLCVVELLGCSDVSSPAEGASVGDMVEITGYAQKGPFLAGASVLGKELRDGGSLTQTGNNYDAIILNDDGLFVLTARMLLSQYVMFKAEGYYRNEVTGEKSSAPLTLYAISDVTGGNKVNINVLTHLEYLRLMYLVPKEGLTVKKAKAQAQKEVLNVIHAEYSDAGKSESFNIWGTEDESGILLAMSIIFQGDRSVAELTELLTQVSVDMEMDGTWDNSVARAELADWAMIADIEGRLETIRKNVEGWNMGDVPDFEKYVRNFWFVENGLGVCSEENEDTVSFVSNADSKYYVSSYKEQDSGLRLVCRKGRWLAASDLEKDTYGLKGAEGDVKAGLVNTQILYAFEGGSWRTASATEAVIGVCTAKRDGEKQKLNGRTYVCTDGAWEVSHD